jgi:hypothetical protein
MQILGTIFGSKERVKIMRLFLFNELLAFDADDIAARSLIALPDVKKELKTLHRIGFIKKKKFTKKKIKPATLKKPATILKVKKEGWILEGKFTLNKPLRALLLDSELIKEKNIIAHIKKSGSIKLIILSGVFVDDGDRKLDILIVGNKIKKELLAKEVGIIESEIGRELSYTFFEPAEFQYRMSMYDKLIRDILENPHKKIINTLMPR